MTIHKEGRSLLLVLIVLFTLLNIGLFFYFPELGWINMSILVVSTVFFLIVLQFFRHPSRTTAINNKHVIAPADGKVVVIEETVESEYFKGPRKQVSIFMSPVNVHVNRNPISGLVSYFKYHPGKYLVAWHPKSSTENERTTIVIKHESGTELLMRQIAGALAKRIKWYVDEGSKVTQGGEFGFIKFGSRVDLYLPLDAEIKVNIGDKTRGGESVVAELA